ncbi:cysteine hydrolase [bacterium]|nr:MAG: cysteine hydrolase [bacterium]
MTKALIIIDIQNEYFSGGKLQLWNTEKTLDNLKQAIQKAKEKGIKPILIRHVSPSEQAPFFAKGSEGVEIHPEILALAEDAIVIEKKFADSFLETNLENVLTEKGIEELYICGMMTQNCVTHTSISRQADKYKVNVLADCCTTTDELIHNIALDGISPKVNLISLNDL